VLGAASLREALADVAPAFEARHQGVDVEVGVDGSSRLAAAIIEGAPADVFASADQASLDRVIDGGQAKGPGTVFATNELAIVVAAGNPLGIENLNDLLRSDVVLALCADLTPCGAYTRRALRRAGLEVPPSSAEASVADVLARVQLGEADAGVVYETDLRGASGVEGVELADDVQVRATYPAAVLADAPNPDVAAAFVAFLTSAEAQAILRSHGFGPP
jgi:molybdate transport system substrate-binding protein